MRNGHVHLARAADDGTSGLLHGMHEVTRKITDASPVEGFPLVDSLLVDALNERAFISQKS